MVNWTYTAPCVAEVVRRTELKASRRAYWHAYEMAGMDPSVIPWACEVLKEGVVDSYRSA